MFLRPPALYNSYFYTSIYYCSQDGICSLLTTNKEAPHTTTEEEFKILDSPCLHYYIPIAIMTDQTTEDSHGGVTCPARSSTAWPPSSPTASSRSSCKCWSYWRNMILYWTVGHGVAMRNNYYNKLWTVVVSAAKGYDVTKNDDGDNVGRKASYPPYIFHFGVALIVTVFCQRELNTRYTDFGRRASIEPQIDKSSSSSSPTSLLPSYLQRRILLLFYTWAPVVIFTVCNGFFETFIFLATYDYGKSLVCDTNGSSSSSSSRESASCVLTGFMFYYFYMALIHILFWLPFGLPPHTIEEYQKSQMNKSTTNFIAQRQSTPAPFHKHGMPLLTIISVAWLSFYEMYDNDDDGDDIGVGLLGVCLLHCVVDASMATNIRLQLPSMRKTSID